jgi:PKD repeat protein
VYLYKAKITIAAGDKIQLVYKTNKSGSIKIKAADKTNPLNLQNLTAVPTSTSKNGWTVDVYDLSEWAGKTLTTIGLGIKAEDGNGFTAQLGQLALYPANYSPAAAQVTNLKVENTLGEISADLRVVWDKPASDDVHHFNVYLERGGVKNLVGQTRNEGFYIPKFARNGQAEKSVKVSVTAVNKNMEEAAAGPGKEISFPDIKLPEVTLKASKTLIKVGDEITVTAKATSFPEDYTWKTSDGVTLKSSNGNTAIYTFTKEGLFDISVDVRNAVGAKSHTETKFIKVSAKDSLIIVSRKENKGKIKSVSSYMTGSDESPEWLIDDTTIPSALNQKWCAGGEKEHWVILELNQLYELYRFQIYDCGNKENPSDNLTYYRIYTSLSGEDNDWTLVLDEKEVPANADHNLKDDYIKPTLGRFVKFVPYNPDMAITIRIWQFDVWGLSVPQPPFISSVSASKSFVKPNEEVTFTAVASGDPTSYDWTVEGGTLVSKKDNQATYKFDKLGVYDVTVTATNAIETSKPKTVKGIVEVSVTKVEGKFPLTIKAFNTDLIAEAKPAVQFASAFGSQDWAFYTPNVAADGALPVDTNRVAISTSGTPFQFGPYNDKNAVVVKEMMETATIEFKENYPAKSISLLTANTGLSMLYAVVNYSDGGNSEMALINLQDWCGAADGTAFGKIGRIKLNAAENYAADQTDVQCRMIETKIVTDPQKTITSITITKMGMGIPAIFAVTAEATVTYMELEQPKDITLKETDTQNIEAAFSLNVAKESNFNISVTSKDNTLAEVLNTTIDETAKKVKFAVKGLKAGTAEITLHLKNGELDLIRKFNVIIQAKAPSGMDAVNTPAIKIGPNPVKAGEKITVVAEKARKIRLLSLQGVLISEQLVNEAVTSVSTTGLQAGTYLIQVIGETSTVSKVIVK